MIAKPISSDELEKQLLKKQKAAIRYLESVRKRMKKHRELLDGHVYCDIVNSSLTAIIDIKVKQDRAKKAILL